MRITIKINTENAAFQDDYKIDEVFRIMQVISRRIATGDTEGRCKDINGNIVGDFKVTGK